MTEREALLRAVLVDPADDLPRLVYADWLEENGEAERAVFIRCHVEEERLRHTHRHGHPGGCRKCKLVRRVCRWVESDGGGKAVFRESFPGYVGAVWYGGRSVMVDPADRRSTELEFVRGMVGHVSCTLAEWVRHGDSLVSANPVELVTLTDRRPHLEPATERWGWFTGSAGYPPRISIQSLIPIGPLMMLMARNAAANGLPVTESSRWFPTEGAARRALSDSLIDIARGTAGLPLLAAPASPGPSAMAVGR